MTQVFRKYNKSEEKNSQMFSYMPNCVSDRAGLTWFSGRVWPKKGTLSGSNLTLELLEYMIVRHVFL